MQKLIIKGKKELIGKISISGSKNATLPILAASILANKVKLTNIPLVKDIFTMVELLNFIGLDTKFLKKKNILEILNKEKKITTLAPYKLVKTMRAGVLVLGSLLTKYGKAKVSLPGGCAIGTRPVDLHLFALKKMGAKIKIKNGYIIAESKNGLKGSVIKFPSISVGATENALLAAYGAKGKTVLKNCAIEPEVKDLILFLKKLGGKIKISGRTIIVEETKIKKLSANHEIIFDRIEAGTYMIASALIGKKVIINKIDPNIIKSEIDILKKMGVKINKNKGSVVLQKNIKLKKINVITKPYPGFPTDLQAQLMVLMTQTNGLSKISENIFENRFMHVPELKRMGAKIKIKNKTAFIEGPSKLTGAEVMATDLRASVSLVLAGLIAENTTVINRIYHLDRGYEFLEKKLKNCKAEIKRI
ncbi:UDP-N-acetylglucosamine 1-carboxyvinyltransferase [Pelagibacteraceae bacterium]|jgi:UDP-N-acetylglucosamine 1-carboxyvinyltransferase|nr:UDP-N-acetylglucosamine 1-carboxyvinyltransferase [Pelagibacteraceae bacterium]MDC1158814.1 UDP-N-acetylglucosamine 1-carboxyvinyltransferase [Pelagibacteraceae bacterium]